MKTIYIILLGIGFINFSYITLTYRKIVKFLEREADEKIQVGGHGFDIKSWEAMRVAVRKYATLCNRNDERGFFGMYYKLIFAYYMQYLLVALLLFIFAWELINQ